MKRWLKNGLLGIFWGIVVLLSILLLEFIIPGSSNDFAPVSWLLLAIIGTPLGYLFSFVGIPIFVGVIIGAVISLFIVGYVIGLIVGKIKEKRK